MSKDNDLAFPVLGVGDLMNHSVGMSKREYFAAHAPIDIGDAQDQLRKQGENEPTVRQVMATLAVLRYAYADAMIAS